MSAEHDKIRELGRAIGRLIGRYLEDEPMNPQADQALMGFSEGLAEYHSTRSRDLVLLTKFWLAKFEEEREQAFGIIMSSRSRQTRKT